MKRFNWYFADGATYSFIDSYSGNEGEFRPGDRQFDNKYEDYAEEQLPYLVDRHGEPTILVISPA